MENSLLHENNYLSQKKPMCGRYSITKDIEEVAQDLEIDLPEFEFEPRYNIAPSQRLPIITNEAPRQMQLHRWGLIPFWAKDPKIGYKLINARGETIAEKPSFRSAFKQRRCLVPLDGFYEWKKTGTGKQPFHIRMQDRKTLTFAGLWESWKDPEGKEVRSFTIVTTTPNELMADLHHRMPVILDSEERKLWLNTEAPLDQVLELVRPYEGKPMEAVRVSTKVNSPRNEGPDLLQSENSLF